MQVQEVNVKVRRSLVHTTLKSMPPYEAMILAYIYGEGNVEIQDASGVERSQEPHREYRRLERLYGQDKQSGDPRISKVFGFEHEGRFKKAMREGLEPFFGAEDEKRGTESPKKDS